MKTCTKCKLEKDLEDFHKSKSGSQWRQSICKPCNVERGREEYHKNPSKNKAKVKAWTKLNPEKVRGYQRKIKYGLTVGGFQTMLSEQANCCACCGDEFDKPPHVDHCHRSGKIRGLLCRPCNVGLGNFKESPIRLKKAASYIVQFE